MSYNLFWRSPALPFIQKQNPISVPAGAVVSNASSLRFTGKGATNYGKIHQENMMRLLESHAGDSEPPFPTVGQTWYDTSAGVLKVCTATPPLSVSPSADWRAMNATFVTDPGDSAPANPELGDTWFQRTGTQSGILHVYDGIGRYPLTNWDAHALWSTAATTTLGIRINTVTFAGAIGSNYNEAYIHGFIGSTPADVPGSITIPTGTLVVPAGTMYTSRYSPRSFIVYDTGGTMVSTGGPSVFFSVRRVGFAFDAWEYDNNNDWVSFTPTPNMYVIGYAQINGVDSNASPGITFAEVWTTANALQQSIYKAQAALTKVNGGVGGWSQVWPQIQIAAGRDEFEEMHDTLMSLIGSPIRFGGSESLGRSVDYLTDMATLDASRHTVMFYTGTPDPSVGDALDNNPAAVEPNAADWDLLLAATKYAVSRLELPSNAVSDISSVPFVQDGRPLPEPLFSLPSTDVRYAGVKRKYNRNVGSVTMNRLYAQTANLLEAAVQNRYLMKGIFGTSGTNTAFPAGVVLTSHQRFQIPGSSLTGTLTHGLDYVFHDSLTPATPTSHELKRFFYSAQAIDVVLTHTPSVSPTAQDLNVVSLLSSQGRIRITADKLLVMTPISTPALSIEPVSGGFNSVGLSSTTLHTIVSGGITIIIRAQRTTGNTLRVFFDITSGGALTGVFEVKWGFVDDQEIFSNPGPTRVYPTPLQYAAPHLQGSVLFVSQGT